MSGANVLTVNGSSNSAISSPSSPASSPASSLAKDTGPSSPTPSISCQACAQLSQLEIEAFAAVRELAPFVRSIVVSEMLTRTPELLFLNVVTLERESFCIELTQKGWRICSDRLDCMYGDFRKLEMHTKYYDTIYALLDNLSSLYREQFGMALAQRLGELQQSEGKESEEEGTRTTRRARAATSVGAEPRAISSTSVRRHHSSSVEMAMASAVQQHRRQPCAAAECPELAADQKQKSCVEASRAADEDQPKEPVE